MSNLILEFSPSKWCIVLFIASAILAVFFMTQTLIPVWLSLIAIGFIILYVAYLVYRYALLRSAKSIVRFEMLTDGSYQIWLRNNQCYAVNIGNDSFISPRLALLNLRDNCHRQSYRLLIFKDSCSPDLYRRLFVLLRFDSIL